ncbi:protein tyrosine phosphatase [Rhizobiales bacterium RZME27]|uniref:Protein tyrosine phosphatase n=1 Tax=Endobacterium cereale TaxID=2663029 RepID=A0A6A8AHX5_9HYPH|nr:dual specificity protein phosphatase family protein [Endobacterium cereale]MEB2845535.1 dual specificity protein phosphatase family protein [Endobacterium cereale]MQY48836.1 protein tyrosine phosphatase [Endobacterium cereale]
MVSKTWLQRLVMVFFIALAGGGGYIGVLHLSGNFHTVIPGELYRSAQPTPDQIERYVKQYGIRTIVNLRGENDNQAWYDDEIAAARKLDIRHINFRMSAYKQLTGPEADKLVALMKDAPKPILIHCLSGADRTGLVSVIYSNQVAGLPEHQAERQLSILFGHVGIPLISAAYAMDESWHQLERHYGIEG